MPNDFVSDLNAAPTGTSLSTEAAGIVEHGGSLESTSTPNPAPAPSPEAPEAEVSLSLRDQISKALKGESTPPVEPPANGAARNPDGTFAPKPVVAEGAEAATPPGQQPIVAQIPYPQNVPGMTQEIFTALPAETQQAVARTMENLNQQSAQYAGYAQIEQLLAPRRQGWAINGMSDGQVLNQLFALSDFADRSPGEFIQYLANQRGVDLEELIYGQEPVDPTIAAYEQRLHQMEQRISGYDTQQQQQAHNGIVNEVLAFADEKGADGQPLRPYFSELGNDVLPFIQVAMQQTPNRPRTEILTDAYDRACWANPSVRAKMQQAETARAEAVRLQGVKDAALRARNAGVSVAGGVPSSGSPETNTGASTSLRGAIQDAIASASS